MRSVYGNAPQARSRILLVDDEPEILVALTDLLEDEFDILSSTDPLDALNILRDSPDVAVIVSDQRMPNLNGDAFLAQAREISDARGILLTGYADLAAVVAALNQGRIQFYAHKPWESDALRAMVREVAEHYRLERALLTERVLLHGLMETLPLGLVFSDAQGRVIRHNLTPDRQVSEEEGVLETSLYPETERAAIEAMRARTQERGQDEHLVETVDDDVTHWHEFIRAALPWPRRPGGDLEPINKRWQVGIERDVTERLAMELRLRQDDKMRALGTLSGGIAHDFNNLLTAILGSLELLSDLSPPSDPMATKLLENAAESARRGTVLTRRLLEFGRPKPTTLQPVPVIALISGMRDLLAQSLNRRTDTEGETGRCTLDLAGVPSDLKLPPVMSDPGQLEMALLNLCINARDAMPQGGSIAIAAHYAEATQGGSDHVVVTVADHGCGMPPEVVARIFEPFFTTKGIGSGTGLGLSTIYGFLRRCNGDIQVQSMPGEGTRMALWLPVCQEAECEQAESEADSAETLSPQRILVADDEDGVRLVTEQFLRQDKHEVVGVSDGTDVIALIEAGEKFDLVALDLLMPGMSGRECGEILGKIAPDLPILYISGYADPDNLPEGAFVLGKPFTPQMLRRAVANALRRNS
ncbi:response regulator [Kozakia baliensis]|uniref:response regulator n=1 Tax=Kozakia baliensis TaxID=153496 RepID=UPI00087B44BD|nr:response regulator [Kozakia baliensis]AOX20145.1 hypothetical protein A0U90_07415 [Kozakia baliensis]